MKKIILLTCFFTFSFSLIKAQYPKEFPSDNAAYGKAYSDFLKTNCSRDDCKKIADQFAQAITSGKAATYFPKIKEITQTMLMKKAPAFPAFMNLATLLIAIETTKANVIAINEDFNILQILINNAKSGNTKEFTGYMEYLINLYTQNSLYYTNTNSWRATGDYTVDVKAGKPVYTFPSTDLIGVSNVDTMIIKNEKGEYYPLENLWIGRSGSIAMQREGFDPASNFVLFGNHQIDFTKSDIIIDSAKLTFKPILKEVLLGAYTDKLLQAKSQEKLYPKFRSYSNNVNFSTLGKEVQFSGGFQLEGTNIYGVGADTILPKISLLGKDGKELVRVTAKKIQIKEFKDFSVEDASMTIKLKDNTITHSFINFTYISKTKDIRAYRDVKPLSKQPFVSDYHKMFIYADGLVWNLDSSIIKFNMVTLSGDIPAIFESYNYYQPNLENKYKGPTEQGPIDKIYRYYESSDSKYVDAQSIAANINPGAPFSATQSVFFKLVEDGYIGYDPTKRVIEVKEKLINQALAARGKQDYDFIKFASFKRNLNARLDINTNLLEVYGVEEINMSTKAGVKFIPNNDTVKIGKNRQMTLAGKVQVGNFDFVAKKVDFDYDSYSFKMKNIDSMVIYVPDSNKPDERGVIKLVRAKTPIQNISGVLQIAEPNNKSGTNNNPKYPYFNSGDSSKIAYDNGVNGAKYDKNKFYYQVFPFELSSLNKLESKDLNFDGRLISGGIFEPIRSGLKLQDDKALGIDVTTGAQGYNLFGNKGKYTSTLKLDGSGLSGKGLFEFGPAKLYADTTFFFMDSVYAELDSVRIKEDKIANFPQASINQSNFVWNVNQDSLIINQGKGEKFSMYNATTELNGKLILHKKNLYGKGVLAWNHTKLQSDDISFKARNFEAKNGKLNLSTDDGISLLASNDVNAKFDLDKRIADIELNKDDTIPLESFKFVANPKFMHFDLAKNNLVLKAISPTAKFFLLSTEPLKDSLKFVTSEAELNLNDNSIHFAGINELRLADSKVIPDKGEIFIEQDGTVRTLKNAAVVFNADSSFHTIKEATVNIVGRNDFSGSGNYYFKMGNGTIEKVPVEAFKVYNPYKDEPVVTTNKKGKKTPEARDMSKIYTYAENIIDESANFKIDDRVYYKGNFNINSKHRGILLDGYIKMDIAGTDNDWIANKQILDVSKPLVNMDSILNSPNNSLMVGVVLDKSLPEFYTTILQEKRFKNDATIISVKGSMVFSKTEPGGITFGDEKAFTNPYSNASCMKYNEKTREVNASGEIEFGLNLYPCKASSVGTFNFNPKNQKLEITSDLAIKFMMHPAVANTVITPFLSSEESARYISYKRDKTIQRTIAVLTKDAVESTGIIGSIYTSDSMYIPKSMDYNMLLSGTKFYWDDQDASFKSIGRISLAFFGADVVKRQFDAYIELGYAYDGDFINVYLQNSSKQWIYLRIKKGQMGITSSVAEVINNITLLKDSDKIYREKGETIFQFNSTSPAMKDNFVTRMEDFAERFKMKALE